MPTAFAMQAIENGKVSHELKLRPGMEMDDRYLAPSLNFERTPYSIAEIFDVENYKVARNEASNQNRTEKKTSCKMIKEHTCKSRISVTHTHTFPLFFLRTGYTNDLDTCRQMYIKTYVYITSSLLS